MKQLKQGTPVWYKGQLTYIDAVHDTLILRCNQLTVKECTKDITPLTKQEYIRHVMVPEGWQYRAVSKHLIKTVDDLTVVIFVNEKDCKPKIGTALGEITYFTDNNKNLGNQALTHCEILNLLKELENKQT